MSANASEQTPIFYSKGGSGGVHSYKIENIFLQDGGDNHIGICFEGGACQTIVSLCRFVNFDKAIKLLNSGNEFTEFSKIRDCDFRYNNYCIYFAKTGNENSFHGFEIYGCTIGEKDTGNNVFYLENKCVWYNGRIDVTVWKSNNNSLIYSDRKDDDEAHNRFMSLTGTIRIEGNAVFNLFESANGDTRSYFNGDILSLGDNFKCGDVQMSNGLSWIHSNGHPSCAASGIAKSYSNLMDGDTFSLSHLNSNSIYTLISGRVVSSHYEAIFIAKIINANISEIVKRNSIEDWNYTQLFNQLGIPTPEIIMNSDGTITFNYSGSDKDTRKFRLDLYTLPFSSKGFYENYDADLYRVAVTG